MHILVANDDGCTAPGLRHLAEALTALGHQVTVIAPTTNWSGRSQSIVFDRPLTAKRLQFFSGGPAFSLDGAPADCVRVALALMESPPDLVAVGVNHGANLGRDVHRSATVGAAREAVLSGYPALAVSGVTGTVEMETLLVQLPRLLEWAVRSPGQVVNVNLPARSLEEPILALLGDQAMMERPVARPIGDGRTVRVEMKRMVCPERVPGTDLEAVQQGRASVVLLPVTHTTTAMALPRWA